MIYKILTPFCLGIIIAYYFFPLEPAQISERLFQLSLLWIFLFFNLYILYTFKHRYYGLKKTYLNFIWTIFLGLEISTSAILICFIHDPRTHLSYFGKEEPMELKIRVDDQPYLSGKFYHFRAKVLERIITHKKPVRVSGYLLVITPPTIKPLTYGQNLLISGIVQKIRGNPHPGFFNYAQYQAVHHNYYQVFLNANQLRWSSINDGNPILKWIYAVQNWTLDEIDKGISDTLSRGFIKTLLMGFRNGIPSEFVQSFIKNGTVHILSISGMHIALLFSLLHKLLRPLKRIPFGGHFIFRGIILFILWVYAFFTGASPPVIRSAWMMSLFNLSEVFKRNTRTIEILMVSALFQLILEPYNLFDLSFQLSYGALLSILLFQKPIKAFFPVKNSFLNFFSEIIIGSLAAQLGTLPLTLYYFHQIPVYFMISNLIIIPLSSIILYEGIIYLLIIFIHLPFTQFGLIVNFSIQCLYQVSGMISSLPGSLLSGLYINFFECLLITALLISFYTYLKTKNLHSIHCLKIFFLIFIMENLSEKLIFSHQESLFTLLKKNYGLVIYCQGNKAFAKEYVRKGYEKKLLEEEIKTFPIFIRYHRLDTLFLKKTKDSSTYILMAKISKVWKGPIKFPFQWAFNPDQTDSLGFKLEFSNKDSIIYKIKIKGQSTYFHYFQKNYVSKQNYQGSFTAGNYFFSRFK